MNVPLDKKHVLNFFRYRKDYAPGVSVALIADTDGLGNEKGWAIISELEQEGKIEKSGEFYRYVKD